MSNSSSEKWQYDPTAQEQSMLCWPSMRELLRFIISSKYNCALHTNGLDDCKENRWFRTATRMLYSKGVSPFYLTKKWLLMRTHTLKTYWGKERKAHISMVLHFLCITNEFASGNPNNSLLCFRDCLNSTPLPCPVLLWPSTFCWCPSEHCEDDIALSAFPNPSCHLAQFISFLSSLPLHSQVSLACFHSNLCLLLLWR